MVRSIVSFLASVFTAIQVFLFFSEKEAICFNAGCEIVDSLTTIPAVYFNVAGFFFFQTLFWCFLWGRKGSEYWHKFAQLLLLAGIVAEAVLVFFQYSIANVFCSYCLIIFGCILFLNIACGLRQSFRATVLFFGVFLALSCLQFKQVAGSAKTLDAGSCAQVSGSQKGTLYLFFSSTCAHCEKVIEGLKEENNCTVRFNPIEKINSFQFPGAQQYHEYEPGVNMAFLKNLSINEVPALVVRTDEGAQVYTGGERIQNYLDSNCRENIIEDYSGSSAGKSSGSNYIDLSFSAPPAPVQDDRCGFAVDCAPEKTEPPTEGGDK